MASTRPYTTAGELCGYHDGHKALHYGGWARLMLVHLGGNLNWYDPERRSWVELDPPTVPVSCRYGQGGSLTPAAVAQHLGLPRGEIALVAVNGRVVGLDAILLNPDDRVEFYPAIGGG